MTATKLHLLLNSIVVLAGACDVVPADEAQPPEEGVGSPATTGAYTARIDPKRGRLDVFALPDQAARPPGGARAYDYSGASVDWVTCVGDTDCLPPSGAVALYTDQSLVSFWDVAGDCFGAGCATIMARPACMQANVFCGPLQITSNLPGTLHDVVIQLSHEASQANSVESCLESMTPAFANGTCGEDPRTAARIDPMSSNLPSPIPAGEGSNDQACSFCLGNAQAATEANLPGLISVVVPGMDPTQHGIQKAFAALRLANDGAFNIAISVRTAAPKLDTTGQVVFANNGVTASCMTSGITTLTINGGGFGAPGICATPSAMSCPTTGAPGGGYTVKIGSGPAAGTNLLVPAWSDTAITARLPLGTTSLAGQTIQVATPVGNVVASITAPPMCGVSPSSCSAAFPACTATGTGVTRSCSSATGEGICACTVVAAEVTTTAALNALAPCHTIAGNLTIAFGEITSLSALSNLRTVGGNLSIISTGLTSLQGLQNLATVGGELHISDNPLLTSVAGPGASAGLTSLTQVNGNLTIMNNASLAGLAGMRVKTIGGMALFGNSAAFTSLAGLESLTSVASNTNIQQAGITSLSALSNLKTVGGLSITNTKVTSLTGLENLTTITNGLGVGNNSQLVTLTGLPSLVGPIGSFQVYSNPVLTAVGPLGLTRVTGGIAIQSNPALVDLSGLASLSGTSTFLNVLNNASLVSLAGLSGLSRLTTLSVVGNTKLADLSGLSGLTGITELTINNNPLLGALSGLGSVTGLTSVSINSNATLNGLAPLALTGSLTTLQITANGTAFTSLAGCEGITQVTGSLSLRGMPVTTLLPLAGITGTVAVVHIESLAIASLAGLGGINRVSSSLQVRSMQSLTSLSGLGPVAGAVGDLHIFDVRVSSLAPLSGITRVTGTLQVSYTDVTTLAPLAPTLACGSLLVLNNGALTTTASMSGLVPSKVNINNNPALTTLGLTGATTVTNPFQVYSNVNLCVSRVTALDTQNPNASCTGSFSNCTGNKTGC